MTRGALAGKIQTVLGPIAPEALGRTLMHEHVLCDIRPPGTRSDNDLGPEITLENVWQINYGRGLRRAGRKYMLDLEDIATREVAMMRNDGGNAIVELTCGGLSPDPEGLRRIAAGTGVHLIMGCGYYVNDYQDPRNHGRSVDDFAREMIGQILEGAWCTDVRAGMIR
jgi:phosphotriesterase-related protein